MTYTDTDAATVKATIDRYRAEARQLLDRAGNDDLTGADAARFDELTGLIEAGQRELADLERDAQYGAIRSAFEAGDLAIVDSNGRDTGSYNQDRGPGTGQSRRRHRDPWTVPAVGSLRSGDPPAGGSELKSRAADAIERMHFADDEVREICTRHVERDDPMAASVSQVVLASTSPTYTSAFIKLVRSRGDRAVLNEEERAAYTRAMSTVDTDGGFLMPFQLDPTIILTASGSVNEVRMISRVVTTTSDVWHGVSSAGVTGSWDGEAEEVSDDAPTLVQPAIPVHKYQSFVPFSHELQQDAAGLAADIAQMIAFDKDAKESIAFVTGSGTGQPTGIITALTGGASVVGSLTTDTLAVSDVYNLDDSLPQRWAANGSWLAHRKIYNKMRQFDTNGGASLWGQLAEGRKRELLGRPDYISEAMDGVVNAGQDNYVLLFGDFRNYVVVDRLGGTTLSYVPNLFGANRRPTGQAGWHAWVRTGGACVNTSAFRLLNVT